jgi:hypothetical protein
MRKRVVFILTVVIGTALARPTPGAVAYLPSVGPAPLRFQAATAPGLEWAWKRLQAPDKNNAPARSAETLVSPTNGVVANSTGTAATNTVTKADSVSAASGVSQGDKTATEPSWDAGMMPDQSDDLSTPVTPQVLAEFFKAGPGGKNPGAGAGGKAGQIGFTPPTPKSGAESRATYKTQ